MEIERKNTGPKGVRMRDLITHYKLFYIWAKVEGKSYLLPKLQEAKSRIQLEARKPKPVAREYSIPNRGTVVRTSDPVVQFKADFGDDLLNGRANNARVCLQCHVTTYNFYMVTRRDSDGKYIYPFCNSCTHENIDKYKVVR